jgi:hypothetical protein
LVCALGAHTSAVLRNINQSGANPTFSFALQIKKLPNFLSERKFNLHKILRSALLRRQSFAAEKLQTFENC